jgi:transglutaminase-like putative cysteine protease
MTQDRRMTLTVAAAVVLVSTVLFPPFDGSLWFYAGMGAVIAVAAAGTLSRLRTLPASVCLAISLIGLLLYLNLAFEARRSLIFIIPTPASLSALLDLLRLGLDDVSKVAPPALNIAPLVLLSTGGIGITAVLTDLIAVRLRSTALAGLPLLVLFTVPVTINVARTPLSTGVIFCLATAGYLAMLSADGRERIRVWGRLVSLWRNQEGDVQGTVPVTASGKHGKTAYRVIRGPDTRTLAAAGRRVGLASIVLALCAPLLVPGLHAAKLASSDWVFGSGSGGSGSTQVPDPLAATASQLQETHPVTVLTYTTSASPYLQQQNPQYLEQEVYTNLTATDGWKLFTNTGMTTVPFTTKIPVQDAGVTNVGTEVTTSITIPRTSANSGTGVNFLPAPYPPIREYGAAGTWEVEPDTLMLVTQNGSLGGLSYQIVNRDFNPANSNGLSKAPKPTGAAIQPDLQLPTSYKTDQQLLQLALKEASGAQNEYLVAQNLMNWLANIGGFTYDIDAAQISNANELYQFLTKSKTGDCVQFSFAMTVLLRMLGIPARIAVGYTQGTKVGDHYVVKSSDAHAWPEVYFAGYGWIRFEPTPSGQGTAHAPAFEQLPDGPIVVPAPIEPTSSASTGSAGKPPDTHVHQLNNGGALTATTTSKPSAGTPWTALALAVLAAIALACGVIAIVAPTAQRAISSRPYGTGRRRRRLSATMVIVGLIAAGIVALALDRLMSRTTGLSLSSGWATVGIAFGAACAFALAVPTCCRALLRRWRWMRASDDAARAHAAWEELCADLADFGVSYLPSESPRALTRRVSSELSLPEAAVEAISVIALAEERATYAARPSDSADLHRDSSTARRGIAAAAGRAARWRATLFPASTMSMLADAAAKVTETWAIWIRVRLNPWGARTPEQS